MSPYHTTGEITDADTVYVERPVDRAFAKLLSEAGQRKIPVLYGRRQAGKTSLVMHYKRAAASEGVVGFVDCRDIVVRGGPAPTDNAFVSLLSMAIATAIGAVDAFLPWWRENMEMPQPLESSSTLFKRFLREVVIVSRPEGVTVILDEIDRVLQFGRLWEFLLDATYDVVNREEFRGLRFAIVGLLRPVDLAFDDDTAKYEHFAHLYVGDFDPLDPNVVEGFAQGLEYLDEPVTRRLIASVVLSATSGQPFLTSLLLSNVADEHLQSVSAVEQMIAAQVSIWRFGPDRQPGERPVHFDQPEHILHVLKAGIGALDAYESILSGRGLDLLAPRVRIALLGSGLVAETPAGFSTRCPIYEQVFDSRWVSMVRPRLLVAASNSSERDSLRRSRREHLPRVLVVNIGGTLGMDVATDGRLVEVDNAADFFRKTPYLAELIDPIVETPLKRATDGANIVPENWAAIARTIHDYRGQDIAGALVVAGTDTLAYAASAVAFALGQGLRFPVVFTGAQAPVTKWHGDAQANLLRAAYVARMGEQLPEVVVVFNDLVLRAVRTEKIDDFRFDAFAAPSQGPLAIIGESLQFQLPVRKPVQEGIGEWVISPTFEPKVLKVSQYPGLDVRYILAALDACEVKGLLIESLGLGNLPVVDGYSLIPAIQRAKDLGIPVLISGRYPIQPEFIQYYKPASEPLQLGAISAGDMAPPAALTKFMWAIAQVDAAVTRGDLNSSRRLERIRALMENELLGEGGLRRRTP